MYKYLKKIQPVAEEIGEINTIQVYTDDRIMGNQVRVKGTDKNGRIFELELAIKDADGNA